MGTEGDRGEKSPSGGKNRKKKNKEKRVLSEGRNNDLISLIIIYYTIEIRAKYKILFQSKLFINN